MSENDAIRTVLGDFFAENRLDKALEIVFHILHQDETIIARYFSWFQFMPSPSRRSALERTRSMLFAALYEDVGGEIAKKNEFPWSGKEVEELKMHKEILTAIIVSQAHYHYNTLHELRPEKRFVDEMVELFRLAEDGGNPVDEPVLNIQHYAANLYLPGQISRGTAGVDFLDVDTKKVIGALGPYLEIIESRSPWKKGKAPGDKKDRGVTKIWHYLRNIPLDDIGELSKLIKKIEGEFSGAKHIALHRRQGNILDRFFPDEFMGMAADNIQFRPVISNYLWQLFEGKQEEEKDYKLVLRKRLVEAVGGKKEEALFFEPYLAASDFFDKMEKVRNFPGLHSRVHPESIREISGKLQALLKDIDRAEYGEDISKGIYRKMMFLKMIEAFLASTLKAEKFDFNTQKEISYYDYYYLPYPLLKYIFEYFACYDLGSEFFVTVEFEREDFDGDKEGDLWMKIPDMKAIEKELTSLSNREQWPAEVHADLVDLQPRLVILVRLLKSLLYRYLLLTITLLSVTVGFKNLFLNIRKKDKKLELKDIGLEDDCLATIGEKFGCRPLYTKYISDFQYKPSQVRLEPTVSRITLDFKGQTWTTDDLFIGIDIGGTNMKISVFRYGAGGLESQIPVHDIAPGHSVSFKTFSGADEAGYYSASEKFVDYIADKVGGICKKIGAAPEGAKWRNIYVGVSFPGPVFDNQLAGISGVVRKLDKELISIKPQNQIDDSHIDVIQKKIKLVEPLKTRLKERLSSAFKGGYESVYVNMTNDGTAEAIGNLHKYWEEKEKTKDGIDSFDYIIVLKAGTGTAGAVLKKLGQKGGTFVSEEGPSEFGKLVVNAMRRPRSFEVDLCQNISSYIIGEGEGGWPGLGEYISQKGLNHLLKVVSNEELFGKIENLGSEEVGKIIETESHPFHARAREAAKRLGYIIADTIATIKIIYRISGEDNVGVIISGGVLPKRSAKTPDAPLKTGDIVLEGVKERLAAVHHISLDPESHKKHLINWSLLELESPEPELGCRGSVIYSVFKEKAARERKDEVLGTGKGDTK